MTEPRKPTFFVRMAQGAWRALNFTRRLVFGLLTLFLLLGLLAGLGKKQKTLEEKTALVIAPRGSIVEQYSANPMDRAIGKALGEENPETQLRDSLRALNSTITTAERGFTATMHGLPLGLLDTLPASHRDPLSFVGDHPAGRGEAVLHRTDDTVAL